MHTHTNIQHSSLVIALCPSHTTQLDGQIEAALISLHFFFSFPPFSSSVTLNSIPDLTLGGNWPHDISVTTSHIRVYMKTTGAEPWWQVSVRERRWIEHSRDWLHRPVVQVDVTMNSPLAVAVTVQITPRSMKVTSVRKSESFLATEFIAVMNFDRQLRSFHSNQLPLPLIRWMQ